MPSSTTKQAKVMSALAHGWHPDKGSVAKIPLKVAEEFHAADKGHKYGKGHHEKVHAALSTARKYNKKADGGEVDDDDQPALTKGDKLPVGPDWSKYNQPMGELKPASYTPTQQAGNMMQDALIGAGADPYTAGHLTEGVGNIIKATPLGVPGAAADYMYAKQQGDTAGQVEAALGFIPGVKGAAKGFTKAGAEIADQIHNVVLGASAIPQELHPAANVLAKDLKSFYPKDIAQSAYYLGVTPSEIENNLKSYMSPGAIEAFDKHYSKLMPKAKPAAEEAPWQPTSVNEVPDVNIPEPPPFEQGHDFSQYEKYDPSMEPKKPYTPHNPDEFAQEPLGPEGWSAHEEPEASPSKADDFASALKKAITSKFEDQGGPWKEVAKGPGAKDLVKHLNEDSTHGTIVNALAQQHIMDSPIPTWGVEGQKLQGILKKTEPSKLVKAMSDFDLNDNHVENILSHLPENKVDDIKQYMAGFLKQHGYEVPGAQAKTDKEILQESLKPINWMEYKPQRGKLPDKINWGQNDPEKLKALGVNPNVILYKGGNLPAGEYPEQIFDPIKDKLDTHEPAFFAADTPHVAQNYGAIGGHYVARPSKVFEVDYVKLAKQLGHTVDPESGTAHYGELVGKILKEAKQHNPDLVIMHNMHDYGGAQTQYAFMNTSVLRAPHAAFDPTKLHLRYPLAGLAGGGLFAYGMANDESQAGHMADGGKVKHKQIDEDPQEHEFIDFSRGGLIDSDVPGRTDRLPMRVKAGAFVLPADIPSALGEGNTRAGADILKKMFQGGPYGMEAPHIHGQQFHFPSHFSMQMPHSKHAAGGKVEEEPVRKSKAKVHYREADSSHRCGTCKYAYGPTGQRHCWLVEGMIKPDDVCNLWEQGITKKAEGGPTEHVPIITAGGEFIIHPDVVKDIGHGDMKKGHKVLTKFVLKTRAEHIKTLKGLKPPK